LKGHSTVTLYTTTTITTNSSILHFVICHRRAVAQPCVNGDWPSKGRMAKFDPAQIRNPWTDRHKIWNRWLRPRDDPRAKFRANPSIGGFLANGWNITKNFLVYIIFLLTDLQVRPPGGFSRAMA